MTTPPPTEFETRRAEIVGDIGDVWIKLTPPPLSHNLPLTPEMFNQTIRSALSARVPAIGRSISQ